MGNFHQPGTPHHRRGLRMEPLEPRLALTAQVEWFDLRGWDFAEIANPGGQRLENVVGDVGLDVSVDSGSFRCDTGCDGDHRGRFELTQDDTGALRFAVDVRQRFVLQFGRVAADEVVGVFSDSLEDLNQQTRGAPAVVDLAVYGVQPVQGLTVRGQGTAAEAASVQIVTGPTRELIFEYAALSSAEERITIRIGRLSSPPLDVNWFDLAGWDFGTVTSGGQLLEDRAAPEVVDADLFVTLDSGSFSECLDGGCSGASDGTLVLEQAFDVGALRFAANSLHQFVVELQVVDIGERVGIFTETAASNELVSGLEVLFDQESGADAVSQYATYVGGLDGISVQGGGSGRDPESGAATLTIVTEPATDLVIQFAGLVDPSNLLSFRIGRVDSGVQAVGPSVTLDLALAGQGIVVDPAHAEYFAADYPSITRLDANWNVLETVDVLADIQANHVATVSHIGAIDYHDGYLWIGLLGSENAIAKVAVNAYGAPQPFQVEHVWNMTQLAIQNPEFPVMTEIDPVSFDGRHLWVGCWEGIYRFTVNGESLGDPIRLSHHPNRLGGDLSDLVTNPGQHLFAQGLRAVGNKLYVIFPRFRNPFDPPGFGFPASPMTGLYEFDVSANKVDQLSQPTRTWHIPQINGEHLEGFDFVPGQVDEIYLTNSSGFRVDRLRLKDFAHGALGDPVHPSRFLSLPSTVDMEHPGSSSHSSGRVPASTADISGGDHSAAVDDVFSRFDGRRQAGGDFFQGHRHSSLVASAPRSLRTEWPQQNDFQVSLQDEHFVEVRVVPEGRWRTVGRWHDPHSH